MLMAKERTGQPVRSAERMLTVLKTFTADTPTRTTAEIAEELNLAASTVRRLLLALQEHGFVRVNPVTARFELGFQVLQLAAVALSSIDLVKVGGPVLDQLRDDVRESVQLSVLDGATVVNVASREGGRDFQVFHRPGHRHPAWDGSAPGKVLLGGLPTDEIRARLADVDWSNGSARAGREPEAFLAHLEIARQDGFATNDGETSPDVWAVAAPVLDHSRAIIGALNVPCVRVLATKPRQRELTRAAVRAAGQLSAQLGYVANAS